MKTLFPLLLIFPFIAFASTDLVDGQRYIVPISGPGIQITNPYTDYKVLSGIDDSKKIEVNVSVLNLRTYKENADLSESNKNYAEGSKTVFSYGDNVYTENFIKLSSEAAQNSTKEDLKKLYCTPDGFYPVSSQERLFTEMRKEHKKIMINYYSDSGETLMFGFGVSPESCNSK
ncbi:hypothetical protein SKB45_001996 [Salmonella enterica]|nr:hypothetical protein [Salmonella enterica]ECH8232368.1 hypothetical protein [Salmonella enterica subsp. enterica]ECT1734625.1 hypothetical protein [Salmonella enterica subsp. enterica serovar Saintpaul]ECV4082295.1 hypothetical protein [Salmonella enterica subsp. enterica serovar Sandiego]EAB4020472.1 hypothetical protein [Salmonella enterica]